MWDHGEMLKTSMVQGRKRGQRCMQTIADHTVHEGHWRQLYPC